jgi:hypothetical protein
MKKLSFTMALLTAGLFLFSATSAQAQSSTSVGVSAGRGDFSVQVGHNDHGRNDRRNDNGRNDRDHGRYDNRDHGRYDRGHDGRHHYPRPYPPVYVPAPPVYYPPPVYVPPYVNHPPITVTVYKTTYISVKINGRWVSVERSVPVQVTAYWDYRCGCYGYYDDYGTFRPVR